MSEFEDVSEFADGEKAPLDSTDEDAMAPVVSIEPVALVRPVKVLAILCSFLSFLFIALSVAATEWIKSGEIHEGLWMLCHTVDVGIVRCVENVSRDWIEAVRAMTLLAMFISFIALVVASVGVTTANFKMKYSYYTAAMSLMFLAAVPEVIALVLFPVKFAEDYGVSSWRVGWAYCMGWVAAGLLLFGSLLLCFDRSAEEIVYREQTCYQNESIEEAVSDI